MRHKLSTHLRLSGSSGHPVACVRLATWMLMTKRASLVGFGWLIINGHLTVCVKGVQMGKGCDCSDPKAL